MDVVKKGDQWRAESKGRAVPGTSARRKDEAVKKTADKARANPEAVTVKIHKESGAFQEERTYPRTADPRKSKG
jgi:hypothetical protein